MCYSIKQRASYNSFIDVVAILSESTNPQTYWRVLKNRLAKEGIETVTNCNAFKLPSAFLWRIIRIFAA